MINLLNIDKNAKTVKGQPLGYMTGILYLAPSFLSGYNVCPTAKLAGCEKGCLNTAGRGVYDNVQKARIRKTVMFHERNNYFMELLKDDITQLIARAKRNNLIPCVRLNGTSDIRWEDTGIIEYFPQVQFYDYTKLSNRQVPDNYDLTFSYSGRPDYKKLVDSALAQKMRIATVFRDKYNNPSEFLGRQVVPGDDHDLRFLDHRESVVALYAKGRARNDDGGFVI
jgi:hypothetical protein